MWRFPGWLIALLALVEVYLGLAWALRTGQPLAVAVGTSMEPTIQQGDLVVISGYGRSEQPGAGDVVLVRVPPAVQERFQYPPQILHRVLSVEERQGALVGLQTKGDNTQTEPFTVSPTAVVGRAIWRLPLLGWPALFLHSRWGMIFVFGLVILAALYWYFTGAEPAESRRDPEAELAEIRRLLESLLALEHQRGASRQPGGVADDHGTESDASRLPGSLGRIPLPWTRRA